MPNSLTALGLTTASQAELITQYTTDYQTIYGPDINLAQDTPDGQMMMIWIQATLDVLNLLTQIYNGFDPDLAIGTVLDQRVAINGIQREGGTFSITDITVVTNQALSLPGLDQTAVTPFTVSDNAGTQWNLIATQSVPSAGTYVFPFQAALPGAALTTTNTIQSQVTIVVGVQSINNPTVQSVIGLNEETDASLKIRRQKSVSLGSQGYLAGLLAALENVAGVSNAFVYENTTGTTDTNGVPGHSIWVIVAGNPADSDIANAIYTKRNAGCGMFGETSFPVVQVDGSTFNVLWDFVTLQDLFMVFTVSSLNALPSSVSSSTPPAMAAIRAGLVSSFLPNVAAQVNINELAELVQAIDANTMVTNAGFSVEAVQTITLSGVAASGAFKLSFAGNSTTSIAWNDSASTIQTKLRLLAGLSAVTVAGSISSQSLVVTMTGVSIISVIGYNTNTLATSAPVPVTLAFTSTFVQTLTPLTKNLQFHVSEENIIILPMIAAAPNVTYVFSSGKVASTGLLVNASAVVQFTGLGGYGVIAYSVATSTGGAINATSGLYTAGSAGTDTITVTDELGNKSTCAVTVS